MLSSFCTAPAGFAGRGSAVVRPSLLAAVSGVEGTGLPVVGIVAGIAPRLRGQAATGVGVARRDALLMTIGHVQPATDATTQNDGTTLGFHSSGRPRS